jgi:hypothetical protein
MFQARQARVFWRGFLIPARKTRANELVAQIPAANKSNINPEAAVVIVAKRHHVHAASGGQVPRQLPCLLAVLASRTGDAVEAQMLTAPLVHDLKPVTGMDMKNAAIKVGNGCRPGDKGNEKRQSENFETHNGFYPRPGGPSRSFLFSELVDF